jgi:hypothetical protein
MFLAVQSPISTSPWIQIQETIFSSSTSTLSKIITFWPNILGALGVLLIGWGISTLVYKIIIKSSKKLKFSSISKKFHIDAWLKKANIKTPLPELIGRFLKAYIFTMFFIGAANIVRLTQIAEFLETIINYIPNIIVALIIVLIGVEISNTVSAVVKSALRFSEEHTAEILSTVARYTLIFFSVLAAMVKLDIANTLVEILFIGFVTMLALGGGLAMGLGGKDIAKELFEAIREKERREKKK